MTFPDISKTRTDSPPVWKLLNICLSLSLASAPWKLQWYKSNTAMPQGWRAAKEAQGSACTALPSLESKARGRHKFYFKLWHHKKGAIAKWYKPRTLKWGSTPQSQCTCQGNWSSDGSGVEPLQWNGQNSTASDSGTAMVQHCPETAC